MITNKNKLSSEEQALRDKLNEADFHFQEADWKAIEGEVSAGKWAKYKTLLKTAAAFVAISGAVYFLNQEMQPQSEKAYVQDTEEVAPNTSEEKNIQTQNEENSEAVPLETKSEETERTTTVDQTADQTEEQIESTPTEIADEIPNKEADEVNKELTEPENQQSEKPTEVTFKLDIKGRYCLGEELELSAKVNGQTIDESKYNLRWFINNKRLIQKEARIKYSLDEAGLYQIGLKVNDNNGNNISSLNETIKVSELPDIDFTYEDGDGLFTDFSAEFKPSPKNLDYRWFVDENEITLNENNVHNFQKKGVYFMRMSYTNEANCKVEIEKPVAIMEDFGPFANAFSPNGDGHNEEFMPHGFEDHNGYFLFTVVDLSGKVVFESNSPQHKWNGKFNNSGEALPQGQYIWKIVVTDKKGNKRTLTDQVKLLYLK
ncbi:MAG: gliding motility-associated C-terminal domain-containing protein [Vicingaceae bacterium]